jgi:dUTP pyrophosphatase
MILAIFYLQHFLFSLYLRCHITKHFTTIFKMNIQVSIINTSKNLLPSYATVGSSGVDIRANIDEPININSLERVLVPTGIYLQIPIGFEAQIRPRSGLAINQGITCLNSPGTIDADYRGEIKVILINLSNTVVTLAPNERIAQMVFAPIAQVNFVAVNSLENTQRGNGGFGHSGTQ